MSLGRRSSVTAVLALAFVVLMARPAAAHTDLESTTPAAGATVEQLRTIDLRFSENVVLEVSHVYLKDAAGYLDLAPLSHIDGDPASVRAPVPALGDGSYEVTWHALAEDGDPAQGTFTLTIAAPVIPAPAAPPATLADPAADFPPDTSLAIIVDEPGRTAVLEELPDHGHGPGDMTNAVARGLLDASLATLIGGLAFVTAVWPQGARLVRTRQVLWVAAIVAAFASFELAAFQHAAATGLSTAEALSPWHQWELLQFRFGRIAAARVVLLAVSALLTARLAKDGLRTARSVPWSMAAAVVALGLAETVALLAHTSAPGAMASFARLFHVLGVSVWIGGLVMLLGVVLPRRRSEELLAVLPRFSTLASAAVGSLMVGGLILAVDLVGSPGALATTGYGRMLLAKVGVVGVLLYVASLSRRHVRTLLAAPDRLAAASVTRPIALWAGTEVGLMTLVLGLTALLVARIPPG